jgi:hypothetical protein
MSISHEQNQVADLASADRASADRVSADRVSADLVLANRIGEFSYMLVYRKFLG